MRRPAKREKKRDGSSTLRTLQNVFFILRYAMRAAPVYSIYRLSIYAMNRIIVFFEHTWQIGFIIDAVNEGRPFYEVALVIISIALFAIGWSNLLGSYVDAFIAPRSVERRNNVLLRDMYHKAATIDLACYDDPKFYDDYIWAVNNAPNCLEQTLNVLGDIIGAIVAVLFGASYILTQDIVGVIVVLISFFSIFFINRLFRKIGVKQEERVKPHTRKLDYISRLFYLNDHAKEIRLGDIVSQLRTEFHNTVEKIKAERKKDTRKLLLLGILCDFVFGLALVDGLYVLYLLFMTIVKKAFSYGSVVTLYKSCDYVSGGFWKLANSLPRMHEQSMYIEKIRYFLEYKTTVTDPTDPLHDPERSGGELVLRNVSFAYDGKNPVLHGINLTVRAGEKIALVGYNGAGKTTLVKLMMRLYDPTEGEILWNGENIKNYRLSAYRDQFETVFQDFELFACSVGQNLTLSPEPLDIERANRAVALSGFDKKLSTLPAGYDTPVTREFDNEGVLLSGGEAQSLAIARALYRDSPVIILDEPSSALDPIAEYRLNETMLSQPNKTVITISHRLSTTRMADRIYMLEQGRIVEAGTHDELMAREGKYATMFKLQAQKYQTE